MLATPPPISRLVEGVPEPLRQSFLAGAELERLYSQLLREPGPADEIVRALNAVPVQDLCRLLGRRVIVKPAGKPGSGWYRAIIGTQARPQPRPTPRPEEE